MSRRDFYADLNVPIIHTMEQSRRPLLVPEDALRGHPDVVTTVHKTHADKSAGMDFILSDETPDRMGDVIRAAGWMLTNFKKNPVALFAHRSEFPIGSWQNLRIEGTALRGQLQLAPAGTSERIDEVRRLVDAGILRAVSVGFIALESRPRGKDDLPGIVFCKQELVETSLVSVPANPNALLQKMKSLNISPEVRTLVVSERGVKGTPIIMKPNAARKQKLIAEHDRLVRLRRRQAEIAAEATDFISFYNKPEIMRLGDQSLAHECSDALKRLRGAEITQKAVDILLQSIRGELRRIERHAAITKQARHNLGSS